MRDFRFTWARSPWAERTSSLGAILKCPTGESTDSDLRAALAPGTSGDTRRDSTHSRDSMHANVCAQDLARP